MNRYSFDELRARAVKADSTREDRLELEKWLSAYDMHSWNGEYYDIDGGLKLYPIYDGPDEDDLYTLVDCEIC